MRRSFRTTGSNMNIDYALPLNIPFQLEEIFIHLGAVGGADDLTITHVSGVDAVFSTVLLTQDMTLIEDIYFQPDRPINFISGDSLRIEWANAGEEVYGFTIVCSGM